MNKLDTETRDLLFDLWNVLQSGGEITKVSSGFSSYQSYFKRIEKRLKEDGAFLGGSDIE